MPKINQAEFDELLAGFLRDIDKVAAHQKEQRCTCPEYAEACECLKVSCGSTEGIELRYLASAASDSASSPHRRTTDAQQVAHDLSRQAHKSAIVSQTDSGYQGPPAGISSHGREVSSRTPQYAGGISPTDHAIQVSRQQCTVENRQGGQQAGAGAGFDSPETLEEASSVKTAALAAVSIKPEGHVDEDGGWEPDWRDEEPYWSDSDTARELYRDKGAQ